MNSIPVKRVAGVVAGLIIAGIGTAVLMGYVDQAREKAIAEEAMSSVYVLAGDVARGTPVPDVVGEVQLVDVPARLVMPGAVTDLALLDDGLVAATDLLAGEQLTASRFTDPRLVSRVPVPKGLQEVTLSLDAQRALGGSLLVGDTVGIVASFEGEVDAETGARSPSVSGVVLHKILVTGVQFTNSDVDAVEVNLNADDGTITRAPTDRVLVTLAVDSASAAKLVFASEFGRVWLTLEGPEAEIVGDTGPTTLFGAGNSLFGGP